MKRLGGIFDRITERQTLSRAIHRAARGKRNRAEVQHFLTHLDRNCELIIRELREQTFRFESYSSFPVRDTKSRIIHAPSFRDRVVHHAIIDAAGPGFECGAIEHSYACRHGRGQHAALLLARKWTRRTTWYLKVDIEKFYDSICHHHLRLLLRRRFRDQRFLHLLDRLLESYSTGPGRGIPIGALTSQYLGNFYLDPVDRWAKQTQGIRRYMRYMDDMVFWGAPSELRNVREQMPAFLETMGLRAKHGGELNRCANGVPFLGFILFPRLVRLNEPGGKRLRRNLGKLAHDLAAGTIDELEFQRRSQSMLAHAHFANVLNDSIIQAQTTRSSKTQVTGGNAECQTLTHLN